MMESRKKHKSLNYAELEALYEKLRDEKAQGLGKKAELLKTPSELAKKKDDYLKESPDRSWSSRHRRLEDQDGQL